MNSSDRIIEIIHFWFEGIGDGTIIDNKITPFSKWFTKNPQFDHLIQKRFEVDLKNAAEGNYTAWEQSMRGRLALILLFDQFSRNMYRNTPSMFAYDDRALALSLKSIQEKKDKDLLLIQRVFLYMPLQHAEDLSVQKLSLRCFQRLLDDSRTVNPTNAAYFKYNYTYAQKYFEIIERFGRFPHRNAILNRSSTQEEMIFLKQPGSSF